MNSRVLWTFAVLYYQSHGECAQAATRHACANNAATGVSMSQRIPHLHRRHAPCLLAAFLITMILLAVLCSSKQSCSSKQARELLVHRREEKCVACQES